MLPNFPQMLERAWSFSYEPDRRPKALAQLHGWVTHANRASLLDPEAIALLHMELGIAYHQSTTLRESYERFVLSVRRVMARYGLDPNN